MREAPMNCEAETIIHIAQEDAELDARLDAEACASAALIHRYLGADHKVVAVSDFYSTLVQALKKAWLAGARNYG